MSPPVQPGSVICIFAKPPYPGTVKTRLIPELGPEGAATLAEACLQDTVAMVRQCAWGQCVIAATEPFQRHYFSPDELWLQGEGNLGARLERVLRKGLQHFEMAFALGADSPGLQPGFLAQARDKLSKTDVVLSPSRDGGFYLIGMKKCPPGMLEGIQWSHSQTLLETVMKLREQGLKIGTGPGWFDIDTSADIKRMLSHVDRDLTSAPRTLAFFRALASKQQ
ncbi:MAG TPA: TIGR04282 family arsenosugar biosynthesis glycosyltransferase [Candidatus Sulfotelmatobacter sp.]|nr:TIGR04282 family arsenosugar biosynthesis glycosyltransferase [Candidatus Sulfotelmatobacter sp.]